MLYQTVLCLMLRGSVLQLEMAYDTLLMQAMKKRLRGEVAGQSVRFADVPKRRAAGTVSTWHQCLLYSTHQALCTACLCLMYVQAAKQAIKRLPGGIEVRQTPKDDLVKLSAGFAVLGGWSLLQVLCVVLLLAGCYYCPPCCVQRCLHLYPPSFCPPNA